MSGGKHCYPNSDILINKYDINDKVVLDKLEVQNVPEQYQIAKSDYEVFKQRYSVKQK